MSFKRRILPVLTTAVGICLLLSCSGNISDSTVTLSLTVRISLDSLEAEGDGACFDEPPAISSDGRYIAFASDATNLVPGDTNGYTDVFVRDLLLGVTEQISVPSSDATTPGTIIRGASRNPSISANGRYVAFQSDNNFLSLFLDTNSVTDVFLRDRETGKTYLISIGEDDFESGDAISLNPSVAADDAGTYLKVTFQSQANLETGGLNTDTQIYLRDLSVPASEDTILLSREQGETGNIGVDASSNPVISGDGKVVAFETFAENLDGVVSGGEDNDSESDIYLREIATFKNHLVSRAPGAAGEKGDNSSYNASVSYDSTDSTCIAFQSNATNLITGLQDGDSSDIFVRVIYPANPTLNNTFMISMHTSGAQGDGSCTRPSISGNGRYVAFQSDEASLVNDDNNFSEDVFLRDRTHGVTTRISVATFGVEAINDSKFPAISQDGRYVAFWSVANNLASDDSNGSGDVFRRGPLE